MQQPEAGGPEAGGPDLAQPPIGPPQGQQPPQGLPHPYYLQVPPPPFMMMMPEMPQSETGESPMEYYKRGPQPPFMMMLPQMPQSQTQVQWRESLVVPPQVQQPLQAHPQQYYQQGPPPFKMIVPQYLIGMDFSARYTCPLDREERRKRRMERFSKHGVIFGPHNLRRPDGSLISDIEMHSMLKNAMRHKYAEIALKFYEKSQDAEFEMVEALHSDGSLLVVPDANSEHSTLPNAYNLQEWFHVSFIAKPKNTDCNDASPKYFFAELLKADNARIFNVKYCYTFEPSDDPGFKHGCVFCPADKKFHPGVDGYHIGGPRWSVVRTRIG